LAGNRGRAFLRHHLIDHRRWTRRIPLAASAFETRDRFHWSVSESGPGKNFVKWRPLARRNPIHTLKPTAKAIMHTSFLLLVMSEPSPLTLMITGAISLGLLTIFLRHKLS
jgi:hypothetical protein